MTPGRDGRDGHQDWLNQFSICLLSVCHQEQQQIVYDWRHGCSPHLIYSLSCDFEVVEVD